MGTFGLERADSAGIPFAQPTTRRKNFAVRASATGLDEATSFHDRIAFAILPGSTPTEKNQAAENTRRRNDAFILRLAATPAAASVNLESLPTGCLALSTHSEASRPSMWPGSRSPIFPSNVTPACAAWRDNAWKRWKSCRMRQRARSASLSSNCEWLAPCCR